MNYSEVIDYLFQAFPAFEKSGDMAYKPGLDTVVQLSNQLGAPHNKIKTIHIAGTNGKGSSSHLLASILKEAGYHVGLYTSPHVFDFCERIQINGQLISEEEVVSFVVQNKNTLQNYKASFFEITTVMAFDYFAKNKVDIAIIETGLGGRLDATNIIQPLVSLITNIGMDHMQFLGHTLPLIAREKAGIIKPQIPIVISQTQLEVAPIFQEVAKQNNSPIIFAQDHWKVEVIHSNNPYLELNINHTYTHEHYFLQLGLKGWYQTYNIAGVLEVIYQLKQQSFDIQAQHVFEGCKNVMKNNPIIGRWQVVQESPMVVLEAAHNKEGIQMSMQQLNDIQQSKHIVIGFSADKALGECLALLPREAHYYVCSARSTRAMAVETLSAYFIQNQFQVRTFANVNEAIEAALQQAKQEDVIWVGGSLYLLGDIDKKLFGWHEKN